MDKKDLTFNDEISQKEAVITSKAMDLLDRDRRLNEDKEKERVKEEKLREKEQKEKDREEKQKKIRKWVIRISVVLVILLLLFQVAVLLKDKAPNRTDFEFPDEFEDTIDISKIPELQVDTFDPLYSMLEIYINTSPVFENGLAAGNLLIGNPEGNVYNQVVEIYLKDKEYIEEEAKQNEGKEKDSTENGFEEVDITKPILKPKVLLYRTAKIKPGQAKAEDTLLLNLPAGVYEAVAYAWAVHPEVKKNAGVVKADMLIYVNSTKTVVTSPETNKTNR